MKRGGGVDLELGGGEGGCHVFTTLQFSSITFAFSDL